MDETLLNDLQRTHFNFFWKLTNTANGLVPDQASATNNEAMSSIAATGFGLTAYIVGVERGSSRATKRPNGRSSRYGRSTMRRKAPRPGIFGRIQGILLSFSEPEHQSPEGQNEL